MVYHSWDMDYFNGTPRSSILLTTSKNLVRWTRPTVLMQATTDEMLGQVTLIGYSDTKAGRQAVLYYGHWSRAISYSNRKFMRRTISFNVIENEDPNINLLHNGSFENGLTTWSIGSGSVSLSTDAYSGSYACKINATGSNSESQAYSSHFEVFGGETYNLSSYVKRVSGDGQYKVTIAWHDADWSLIRFDNDWDWH